MDFRSISTVNYKLGEKDISIKPYLYLDKVPPSLFKEVYEWSEDVLPSKDMTITLSDNTGTKVLMLTNKPAVVVDGLGMCEVELRGSLVDIDVDNGSIKLSKYFLPVLHYSNGIHSMTMLVPHLLDIYKSKLEDLIKSNIKHSYKCVEIENTEAVNLNTNFSIPLETQEDVDNFLDEDTINIVTK